MTDLILREECYAIVGACIEVHKVMGCGFHEAVYQECLEIELGNRGIPFSSKRSLKLYYQGQELKQTFIPDVICYGSIIVELKAVSKLVDEHRSQVINYLNVTRFELGLLVNFGSYRILEWERLVFTKKRMSDHSH